MITDIKDLANVPECEVVEVDIKDPIPVKGHILVVRQEVNGCSKCVFRKGCYSEICIKETRSDGKDVYFVTVKW